MRRIAVLALLLVSTCGGTAAAAPAPAPASVRVSACDATARTATFEGDMRSVARAARLQMRFTLLQRSGSGDDVRWARVTAPGLGSWATARPGRSRYVYSKRVAGLQPGATYRVLVRFRWRAADGELLRRATRRSRACVITDMRANLVPLAIAAGPAATPGRATYVVTIANRGRSAAPATAVAFDVGPEVLPDAPAPPLLPRERTDVAFEGPACAPGTTLVAVVDATALLDEAVEADDMLTAPCPALRAVSTAAASPRESARRLP